MVTVILLFKNILSKPQRNFYYFISVKDAGGGGKEGQ